MGNVNFAVSTNKLEFWEQLCHVNRAIGLDYFILQSRVICYFDGGLNFAC